jgi:hypothetical protein
MPDAVTGLKEDEIEQLRRRLGNLDRRQIATWTSPSRPTSLPWRSYVRPSAGTTLTCRRRSWPGE